jgi:hypothetical protein
VDICTADGLLLRALVLGQRDLCGPSINPALNRLFHLESYLAHLALIETKRKDCCPLKRLTCVISASASAEFVAHCAGIVAHDPSPSAHRMRCDSTSHPLESKFPNKRGHMLMVATLICGGALLMTRACCLAIMKFARRAASVLFPCASLMPRLQLGVLTCHCSTQERKPVQ